MFEKVMLVMGLFAFAKQAPKLISDVLGIDSGNMKLGIGGKLAAGGLLGAAGILGGASKSLFRGVTSRWKNASNNWKEAKKADNTFKDKVKYGSKAVGNIVGGLFSGGAGAVSGGFRAAPDSFKAKNIFDAQRAASKGSQGAEQARINRDKYRAGHGGVIGSMIGHVEDGFQKAKSWAGISDIIERINFEDDFIRAYDDYKNAYENGEYQQLTAKINEYKAAAAAGDDPRMHGVSDFDTAINSLKAKQKELRVETLLKRDEVTGRLIYEDMASYMVYNLSNLIQTNPSYAKDLGLDSHMTQELAKKITINNDKIYKDGQVMDIDEIINILESTSYGLDDKGKITGLTNPLGKGLFEDRGGADNARKADTSTVAYKEYKRRQEESKK